MPSEKSLMPRAWHGQLHQRRRLDIAAIDHANFRFEFIRARIENMHEIEPQPIMIRIPRRNRLASLSNSR
jgi:hypothetical protein